MGGGGAVARFRNQHGRHFELFTVGWSGLGCVYGSAEENCLIRVNWSEIE